MGLAEEIKAEGELTGKIILLITELAEKKDNRLPKIIEDYVLIRESEKDSSRIPWKFLEYFEKNHTDLYARVQMINPNPRT